MSSDMSSTDQMEVYDDTYEMCGGDHSEGGKLDEDYANKETVRVQTVTPSRNKQEERPPGAATTEVRCYRVCVVSLGLLCVLLLAVIIWMFTKHTAERDQQQRNIDLLQLTNNNLTQERHQLQISKDQFHDKNIKLTKEKNDLRAEIEKLQRTPLTPQGAKCFGYSCYHISTSAKNWTDSQQDCLDRGGHLVIIDSKEEQIFISGFREKVWIGLRALESGTTWKWVNGNILGHGGYWAEGEPNQFGEKEDCVEILNEFVSGSRRDPLRNWNDSMCHYARRFVCEKQSNF